MRILEHWSYTCNTDKTQAR